MAGDDVTSDEDSGSDDLDRATPARAASGASAATAPASGAAPHVAHSPAGFMGAGGRTDSVDVASAPGTPLPSLPKLRQNPGSRLWRSEIEVRDGRREVVGEFSCDAGPLTRPSSRAAPLAGDAAAGAAGLWTGPHHRFGGLRWTFGRPRRAAAPQGERLWGSCTSR